MATTPITMRLTPCNCGCKGTDSWHSGTLHRAVRDNQVVQIDHPALLEASLMGGPDGSHFRVIVAKGFARFPWGTEPVEQTRLYAGGHFSNMDWARSGVYTVRNAECRNTALQ